MSKYIKSPKKITAMLAVTLLAALLSGLIFYYIFSGRHLIYIGICIVYVLIIYIPKFKPMYRHSFSIDIDNGVFEFREKLHSIKISLPDITEITYKGSSFAPVFEKLTLKTIYKKQTISIDFHYENYLDIWKETIDLIQSKRTDIKIPDRLIKRLYR